MIDPAAEIARRLVERSSLSVFDAAEDLAPLVVERWPHLTPAEARRAVRIFLEMRRADDDFRRYAEPFLPRG